MLGANTAIQWLIHSCESRVFPPNFLFTQVQHRMTCGGTSGDSIAKIYLSGFAQSNGSSSTSSGVIFVEPVVSAVLAAVLNFSKDSPDSGPELVVWMVDNMLNWFLASITVVRDTCNDTRTGEMQPMTRWRFKSTEWKLAVRAALTSHSMEND